MLSDRVKIAVVQRLGGRRPEATLALTRCPTYYLALSERRYEASSLSGPVPLDVCAVHLSKGMGNGKEKGKEGKGKVKLKEKEPVKEPISNPDSGVTAELWQATRPRDL